MSSLSAATWSRWCKLGRRRSLGKLCRSFEVWACTTSGVSAGSEALGRRSRPAGGLRASPPLTERLVCCPRVASGPEPGAAVHVSPGAGRSPGTGHQQRSSRKPSPSGSVMGRKARGRAVAGHGRKDGQAVVGMGDDGPVTVEHTGCHWQWGARARHARLQLNDNGN